MPVTSADKILCARVDFELGRHFATDCFGSQQDKGSFQDLAAVKEITDADYCPMP